MKKIFGPDPKYSSNCRLYTIKDGIKAIGLFFIMMSVFVIMGVLSKYTEWNIVLIECFVNLLLVLCTIFFVKTENRDISTIGITCGRIWLSIALGTIVGLICLWGNCISDLISGEHLVSYRKILIFLFYFFTVAVSEEFVFRGYIGTRICGLVKYKILAVVLTGLLFVFIHFPYRIIAMGWTLDNIIKNIPWIINLFVTHLVLSFIYIKTNSLIGAIIPHWISDFANQIVAR